MTKQANIAFTVILLALLGVVIIILLPLFDPRPQIKPENSLKTSPNDDFSSESSENSLPNERLSPPEVTSQYLTDIKQVIGELNEMMDTITKAKEESADATSTVNARANKDLIKEKLTSINVPAQFRDFHLSLFLLLSQLDSYFELGESQSIESIESEWIRLKNNFDWLQEQVDK